MATVASSSIEYDFDALIDEQIEQLYVYYLSMQGVVELEPANIAYMKVVLRKADVAGIIDMCRPYRYVRYCFGNTGELARIHVDFTNDVSSGTVVGAKVRHVGQCKICGNLTTKSTYHFNLLYRG
jgi:hypothetical protein